MLPYKLSPISLLTWIAKTDLQLNITIVDDNSIEKDILSQEVEDPH